jgi:predicted RNase H-like HicB family nuclease
MKFRVVIERDPETGDYSVVCPELPGCATAGETGQEAEANIREAIALYLAPGRYQG